MASEPRGAEYPGVAQLLNNGVLLKRFRCGYVLMWGTVTVWTTADAREAMMADQILSVLDELRREEFERFTFYLNEDVLEGCAPIPQGQLEGRSVAGVVKLMKSFYGNLMVKVTLEILKKIDRNDLFQKLEKYSENSLNSGAEQDGTQTEDLHQHLNKETTESIRRAQKTLKTGLSEELKCINEGLPTQDLQRQFHEIYTDLYITEGGNGGISNEHEVRVIETASKRRGTQETAVCCNDIFKPLPGQEKRIRTVLTKGIAGIGKTVSVQKFILDWAEGKANQDIDFIFTLPFRDLNLKEEEFSLIGLLQDYFPELTFLNDFSQVEIQSFARKVKVLFVFDGLDECRLHLDFKTTEILRNVKKPTSVHKLLTNLIQGNLLPSALLWITSRPAAANQIPLKYVHRVTEVRGFNDPQKEEYFRKRFDDQEKASRIISHIKSSRSLYIMCHIPVFCWISATVLETVLDGAQSGDLPKSLTEMYTHFLLVQTNRMNDKYETNDTDPNILLAANTEIILKLGRLAFRQLKKGNVIFYERDLRDCSIDVREASVYSGVCTQFFKKERGLHKTEVYCFVHLSIQEYLAALFVFNSCVIENRNKLKAPKFIGVQLSKLYKIAVDLALKSENGHWDLFVQFLLGLSQGCNQTLLGELLTKTRHRSVLAPQRESRSESRDKTIQYIKKKIRKESSAERTINLFHCLNELNDNSLVEEINNSLSSGILSFQELDPSQCSALAFVLLMSEEVLDEFDLETYRTSAEGHERLLPVIKNCRKARLKDCNLTMRSCEIVASALQSTNSPLRDLDLSDNDLGDSGVELLCAGLKSPNCKLQRLRLNDCNLKMWSCAIVASALQSTNSPLRDLDLSQNDLGDSGVEMLCAGLKSPNCKLQTLKLIGCKLTQGCCYILASVLCSPHSELRDLELRDNELQDSGVRALSAGLEDPHCKLQRLGLSRCRITQRGCDSLASALSSNPSHLRELDLSYNHPADSALRALSAAKPYTLKLLLNGCRLTVRSCEIVASALQSTNSPLRDLDLSQNDLGDSGVELLCPGLMSPNCKVQRLGLISCNLTMRSCEFVASALQSTNSPLRDLDLSQNDLRDSGVKLLCPGLMSPNCKLQRLGLMYCHLTMRSCEIVASALQSTNSPLRDLHLSNNNLGDSGVELLCPGLMSPNCKLQTLGLTSCDLTKGCCDVLASVLRSPHAELRYLELRDNELQDLGVRALSAGLEDPHCKLQRLGLSGCSVTQRGCDSLASALSSNPSHLRELDLRDNHLQVFGVRALSVAKPDTLTLLWR
ncbi:hypothetical protein GJAV_G00271880 [Gymnothorax javanicus]|nr:hypothetical protein GJAV_G00271880 [Gymnothorax javanicus]